MARLGPMEWVSVLRRMAPIDFETLQTQTPNKSERKIPIVILWINSGVEVCIRNGATIRQWPLTAPTAVCVITIFP